MDLSLGTGVSIEEVVFRSPRTRAETSRSDMLIVFELFILAANSQTAWGQPPRIAGGTRQTSSFSCDPYPKVEGADNDREGYHRGQEPYGIRPEANPQSR